ncbi:serine/threonine protein kinase [Paenibacillus gallinarum]|uniref:Serine/threonine protein kinase n=1 Tax=Paenibacillus gallinarum TaxID=2762232 RepID=A0ABR8T595_9BACL|nr:serine/threonine protein kinase [Paenibacillus gallinarum]MBD7970902.1 serine/threonine protein kinase [Paenibacillus gallinarum]
MTMPLDPDLTPGTVVTGKWKNNKYIIQRVLGKGANGIVYLVQREPGGGRYALKMGFNPLDLQSEINVLTSLAKKDHLAGGNGFSSYLKEVDNYQAGDSEISFYVMTYVRGEPLHLFIRKNGPDWTMLVGLRLLKKLAELHRLGYIFCDLKPQNVLVSSYGEVELIDYGGASPVGRSVKQFTEWYDRGYWNAGSRVADQKYDVFSFALLLIHLLEGEELRRITGDSLPQLRGIPLLLTVIQKSERLAPYRSWLQKAIQGYYDDAEDAFYSWKKHVYRLKSGPKNASSESTPTPGWLIPSFALSALIMAGAVMLMLR